MSQAAAQVDRRRWVAPRRWPTVAGAVFAAALAAAFWFGISDVTQVGDVVTAAGFVYLGAAALGQRAAAWPLFMITFVLIGIGYAVPGFVPLWWMLGIVAALTIYGLVRGRRRPSWGLPLQALAMIVIMVVALVTAALGQPWAGLLVGLGLLAHAGWDVYHHRTQRVVASSVAEFCAVLDSVLAVFVIVLTLIG